MGPAYDESATPQVVTAPPVVAAPPVAAPQVVTAPPVAASNADSLGPYHTSDSSVSPTPTKCSSRGRIVRLQSHRSCHKLFDYELVPVKLYIHLLLRHSLSEQYCCCLSSSLECYQASTIACAFLYKGRFHD